MAARRSTTASKAQCRSVSGPRGRPGRPVGPLVSFGRSLWGGPGEQPREVGSRALAQLLLGGAGDELLEGGPESFVERLERELHRLGRAAVDHEAAGEVGAARELGDQPRLARAGLPFEQDHAALSGGHGRPGSLQCQPRCIPVDEGMSVGDRERSGERQHLARLGNRNEAMDTVLGRGRLASQVGGCRQELAGKVAEEHHAWRRGRRPFEATGDGSQPVKEWAGAVQWGLGDVDGCPGEWPAGAEVLQCSRGGGGGREGQHRAAGQHRGRRRVRARPRRHRSADPRRRPRPPSLRSSQPSLLPISPPTCRSFDSTTAAPADVSGTHVTTTADRD